MKNVGIVTCDKWINKIKEDLYLNERLLDSGINSSLISWENPNIDYSKYDCLIIRSIWGYQNKLEEFYKWLNQLEHNHVAVLNDISLIKNNIRKDIQFGILKKYHIPTVQTEFLYKNEINNNISNSVLNSIEPTRLFVVKPIISGSGEKTFLIDLDGYNNRPNTVRVQDLDNLFHDVIRKPNNGLMIQPFISEIDYGELSSIFIDGENTHNIRRYPSIFHEKKNQELEENVSSDMLELAQKVATIPEFQNHLYMRVDMVEHNGKPIIMEVELTEPDLLTRCMPEEARDTVIKTFAKKIEKKL